MPRVARAKSGSRVEEFETRWPITLKNFKVCKIKYAIVTLGISIENWNAIEKPRTELTRDYDKKWSATKKEQLVKSVKAREIT